MDESMTEPSKEVIERYTMGDCHKLAYAIQILAGWPMRTVMADIYEHKDPSAYYIDWTHAFVELPDGHILDIEGVHEWHIMLDDRFGHPDGFNYNDRLEYVDEVYIGPYPSEDLPSIDEIDEETFLWAKWAVEFAEQKLAA